MIEMNTYDSGQISSRPHTTKFDSVWEGSHPLIFREIDRLVKYDSIWPDDWVCEVGVSCVQKWHP